MTIFSIKTYRRISLVVLLALCVLAPQDEYDSNSDVPFYVEVESSTVTGVGSSIKNGTISSFHIERYSGGSLQEISPEALNTPVDTPGYAIGAFQYDHELKVVGLEVPKYPEILNTNQVNITVSNIGSNTESNVNVNLYLNNSLVKSSTISSLAPRSNETITYEWIPKNYGEFNFTAQVPAVSGEKCLSNNIISNICNLFLNYTMRVDHHFNWIEASGGTELSLSDDDSAAVSLPFNFPYYNESFSTIYVSSNGYLSFTDTSPTDPYDDPIPSSNPENTYLIAPFWDDLNPNTGGNIYHESFSDHWVIEWQNINHFYNSPVVGTFEVVLYESGEIVFNYNNIDYTGGGYTCGLNLGEDTRYYNSYQGLTDTTEDFSILFSPLIIGNPLPLDDTTGVSFNPPLSVDVYDPFDDAFNVSFYDASDDSLLDRDLNVGSGENASTIWSELTEGTEYEWYTVADDGNISLQSSTWSFTTNAAPDAPANPSPPDGATVGASPTLSVDVSDTDGENLTVTFYDSSDDSVIGTDTVSGGSGTASTIWFGLPDGGHEWYAVANDSFSSTQSPTWSFTTSNTAPDAPTNPIPSNGANDVSLSPTLSVDVSDPGGIP